MYRFDWEYLVGAFILSGRELTADLSCMLRKNFDTVSNTSHGHPSILFVFFFSLFVVFLHSLSGQEKLGLSTTTTSSPWYVSSASIDIEVQREIFRANVKRDGWKMALEFQSWSHGKKKDEQEND